VTAHAVLTHGLKWMQLIEQWGVKDSRYEDREHKTAEVLRSRTTDLSASGQ
jgi:hypothetical protein